MIKPVVGSWGRMVARANDRDAAEAILEDRATLGSWQQQIFYIQEHIRKPGRDIRAFVVGDETICAIYRTSEHWITNTARGGRAVQLPGCGARRRMSPSRRHGPSAAAYWQSTCVETSDGRLWSIEVNHTMEFRNSIDTTGVEHPGPHGRLRAGPGRRTGHGVRKRVLEAVP